jgi:hypothetical protein
MLGDLSDNLDQAKLPTVENILRTLNKLCYYSLGLCMEAFKSKLMIPISKLVNILEAQIGKGRFFPYYINLSREPIRQPSLRSHLPHQLHSRPPSNPKPSYVRQLLTK